MSEKIIERVAKVLAVANCTTDWQHYEGQAKAAIQAMREPTEEMDAAMRDECISQIDYTKAIYKAAIDAALNF